MGSAFSTFTYCGLKDMKSKILVATLLLLVLASHTLGRTFKEISDMQKLKRLRMTNNGFYGDTFSDGFGVFQTMKKRGFQDYLDFLENSGYQRKFEHLKFI